MTYREASSTSASWRIQRIGRTVATIGIILPLLFIGGLKFTQPEIDAITGLLRMTPWLSWLHPLFGEAGASYFLGIVEISAAILLIASVRSSWAGLLGGALASIIFLVTSSLISLSIAWDPQFGGFPYLGAAGQFLIKDIALLGIALWVTGISLAELRQGRDEG